MDPTYRSLIMQRRKKTNRKGFIPAILAGLAGVNLVSQIGKQLMGRKSGVKSIRRKGFGQGQTVTRGQRHRYGRLNALIGGKSTTTPKYLSDPNLKNFPIKKIGSYTVVVPPRKGRSMPKRSKGFDRNKGVIAKKIIKTHLLGPRKGRFNRRKGDLDSNFLSEFGGDVFNPEPTVSKSWGRTIYENLRGLVGSKEAKILKDATLKRAEKGILDKINKLGQKKAETIASKIVTGQPIPKTYHKDLMPSGRFLGKYRG